MARKLQYGIVGLGTIGTVHTEAIQAAVADAEIAAFCDIDAARLEEKADRYRVRGKYTDFRQMIGKADLDAVYVCVPNHLHRDVALEALKAGRNVFCEKPMALNAAQAQEMAAAAAKSGKVFQLGMVNRQRPDSQLVKQYAEEGFFGTIYHINIVLRRHRGIPGMGGWFTTKAKSGGGCVIDISVHFLDLALWISGFWKPRAASAMEYAMFGKDMKSYKYISMWAGPPNYEGTFDVDDYVAALVRLPGRATMKLDVAWALNAKSETYIEILGDKGGVRFMDDKPLTLITEVGGKLAEITPLYAKEAKPFEIQARKFAAAVRGETPPAATAEQGVAVMALIDALYRSSAEGREVPIDIA
jgi:predicted dehydrogenase